MEPNLEFLPQCSEVSTTSMTPQTFINGVINSTTSKWLITKSGPHISSLSSSLYEITPMTTNTIEVSWKQGLCAMLGDTIWQSIQSGIGYNLVTIPLASTRWRLNMVKISLSAMYRAIIFLSLSERPSKSTKLRLNRQRVAQRQFQSTRRKFTTPSRSLPSLSNL